MKVPLFVTLGFLALFLSAVIVPKMHTIRKEEHAAQDAAQKAVDALRADTERETQKSEAEYIELRAHMAEMRYGQSSGTLYRLCHKFPLKSAEHQAECKALEERMARDDAEDAKHPW